MQLPRNTTRPAHLHPGRSAQPAPLPTASFTPTATRQPEPSPAIFNMPVGDGCGDFYPVEGQWTRLDVEDSTQSIFLLPEGRGHTLSPEGLTLIYASASPPYGIHFHNLGDANTGQIVPAP